MYIPGGGRNLCVCTKTHLAVSGFIPGWIWVFSNIFVGAAVSLGFAHYFVTLFPAVPVKIIAVIICLIFIFINYLGLKESTLLNNVLVTVKVLILLFFVAFGLGFFNVGNFTPPRTLRIIGDYEWCSPHFFCIYGISRVTIMAEEVKEPEITIPRSIYFALGISTVIYIFVSLVAVGIAGAPALAQSGSPLADAIKITGSSGSVLLISLGAMIATASVLLTTIMGISRIIFAMARYNDLPGFLSRISPRFSTPHYAIWITGFFMIAAILLADLALVVAVGTFAMLIFYFIANVAALKLPRKYQRYPSVVPIIGAITCTGLVAFLTMNSWIIGIAGLAIGIAWYVVHKKITK